MLDFVKFGLSFPLSDDIGRFCVGEGVLYFPIILGEVGVELGVRGGDSAGFMLTVTGLVRGSCLEGIFSGGPIGLSSRFLFLFFSSLLFSSLLLLLLFLSFDFSSEDLLELEVIGVIVTVLGTGVVEDPDRLSLPLVAGNSEGLDGTGVILIIGGTIFLSHNSKVKLVGDFSMFIPSVE